MSLEEVRRVRHMPWLRRGMSADMDGRDGRITSGNSAHLRMRFAGQKRSVNVHPTWQMTYRDKNGNILKDYKEKSTDASL